jgi:Type IV secretion-system coupling protein DNA-binding domain
MLAIRSSNLRSVLSATSEGRETYKAQVEGDQQTQQNVRSELDDCSKRFLRIAAAWYRTPEKLLSFSEWAKSPSDRKGIILGSNDDYLETLQLLNQAILYLLCGKLLDKTHPKSFRTFMVLDEFERLGRIPKFAHTVQTSAGRELNILMGVHDFDTLKGHYGDDMHGILGTCGFKAFLRVENPNVAEWISKRIGSQGVRMPHTSTSRGESQGQLNSDDSSLDKPKDDKARSRGSTTTTTTSQQYHTRRAVTPEAIMALPLPSAGLGLQGYFQGPPYATFYRGELNSDIVSPEWSAFANECLLWRPGSDKAFEARSDADFRPPDDTFEPLRELGFERDDKPHTVPLRPPSRAPAPPEARRDLAPPLDKPTDIPPQSPADIDLSDMPRRVRWDKDQNKFEF